MRSVTRALDQQLKEALVKVVSTGSRETWGTRDTQETKLHVKMKKNSKSLEKKNWHKLEKKRSGPAGQFVNSFQPAKCLTVRLSVLLGVVLGSSPAGPIHSI
jgi:hypothetical protein